MPGKHVLRRLSSTCLSGTWLGTCSSICPGMCSSTCLTGTCLSMCPGTCLSTCPRTGITNLNGTRSIIQSVESLLTLVSFQYNLKRCKSDYGCCNTHHQTFLILNHFGFYIVNQNWSFHKLMLVKTIQFCNPTLLAIVYLYWIIKTK